MHLKNCTLCSTGNWNFSFECKIDVCVTSIHIFALGKFGHFSVSFKKYKTAQGNMQILEQMPCCLLKLLCLLCVAFDNLSVIRQKGES